MRRPGQGSRGRHPTGTRPSWSGIPKRRHRRGELSTPEPMGKLGGSGRALPAGGSGGSGKGKGKKLGLTRLPKRASWGGGGLRSLAGRGTGAWPAPGAASLPVAAGESQPQKLGLAGGWECCRSVPRGERDSSAGRGSAEPPRVKPCVRVAAPAAPARPGAGPGEPVGWAVHRSSVGPSLGASPPVPRKKAELGGCHQVPLLGPGLDGDFFCRGKKEGFVEYRRPHGKKLPEEKKGGKEPGPRAVRGADGWGPRTQRPVTSTQEPREEGQGGAERKAKGPPATRALAGWGGHRAMPHRGQLVLGWTRPFPSSACGTRLPEASYKAAHPPHQKSGPAPEQAYRPPEPLTHPAGEAGTNSHQVEGRKPAAGAFHFVLEGTALHGTEQEAYLASSRGGALKGPRGGLSAPARGRGRGAETISTRALLWKVPELLLPSFRQPRDWIHPRASLEIPVHTLAVQD